jgi:hypothetical protein
MYIYIYIYFFFNVAYIIDDDICFDIWRLFRTVGDSRKFMEYDGAFKLCSSDLRLYVYEENCRG